MSRQNDDIEQLKASVSCALVLERLQPDWRLDAAESTRRNLKFRRGPGKILIVNHDGRGWWDPLSAAKVARARPPKPKAPTNQGDLF